MVDVLTSKTIAWEKERGVEFTYDGVSFLFEISVKSLILNFGLF
jgi:protein regulator of cytokinesis 1